MIGPRRRILCLSILAIPLITLSCGQAGSPTSPLSHLGQPMSGLTLSVNTIQGTGNMTFRIDVKNTGTATEILNFGSSQFFDIEVTDQSGILVWRWANEKVFAAVMWSLQLAPGESSSDEAVWDLIGIDHRAVSRGSYSAKIYITGGSPGHEGLSSVIRLTI